MTIRKFLKDQWLLYLAWIVFMALTVFVLWLTPNYPFRWSVVGYLFFLEGVFLVGFQAIYYSLKRKWWAKITCTSNDSLLQDYVTGAKTEEERVQQAYMNQLLREHQETMQQVIRSQEEQKDYIDSWVHEIKVPLAATKLLLQSVEFDLPDAKFLAIENELDRMNDYVEQVLYVARLDSFSKDYLIQETSLKEAIQPVIRSQANFFIQKAIHFELQGDDQLVLTDGKWVAFIFRQLLSNAIKYTPNHGQIMIKLARNLQGVSLSLTDTGIGIPTEDNRRIFDKGFTGSNGRNAQVHSTGLGLYLVKNLSEKLGIEVTVASQVGQGSTFTLYFPQLSYYEEKK